MSGVPMAALCLSVLTLVSGCGRGAGEVSHEAVRVLFVGNSLTATNDLPGMLAALLEAADWDAEVAAVAYPNYGLQDHWSASGARAAIAEGGWDVVVLQQGPSATEGRPSLLDYAARFAVEIVRAGARPALYMVWPSKQRFFDFDGVSDAYRAAAERVDGLLFPAGEAWRAAWRRNPDLDLYAPDAFHPSPLGTFLAALVIWEQITGQALDRLPAEIPLGRGTISLDPELFALLEQAAHEANARFARTP